jgi:hypothetical protein
MTEDSTFILEGRPSAAAPVAGIGRLFVADRRDWLRLFGGLMFGVGALILAFRKLGVLPGSEAWSDFAVFVVLLVAFVLLYGLGVGGRAGRGGTREAEPWQSVFLVFAVLISPLMLFKLLDLLGGDSNNSWNSVWIFAVMAALGAYAALAIGATQAGGFGALALIAAWLAFWDKVLDNPSGSTVRWLLVVIAVIYVGAAIVLDRRGVRQGASLITAAGLATFMAGTLGAFGALANVSVPLPGLTQRTIEAASGGVGWDIFLLVTSAALIGFSARTGRRGPGLVGALGLIAFMVLVGGQLVDQLGGKGDAKAGGWPLVLLIVGAAGIVLSFVIPARARTGDAAPPASHEHPPPGAAA